MSGWHQAMFLKCRDTGVIQRAITKVLDDEGFTSRSRRLDLGTVTVSKKGFAMVVPAIPSFFLARGTAKAARLARLARTLCAPIYDVEVRDSVAVTLFEADALGRLRISGSSIYDLDPETGDAGPEKVASKQVGFGLLPVPKAVHARLAEYEDDAGVQLAEYLGSLAGFPSWIRSQDGLTSEDLVFVRASTR
ncbi:MAG: hypothetical protein IPQ07_07800 [Myxococcales bacterium]|nr:hypothetical protein [Myxococcales bacterium]